jgi:phospho-N-acetylmuramoyl-pentapeptide-transferase
MTPFDIMRLFIPATIAFVIGVGITPIVTHFLYKYKMWKPKAGKMGLDGKPAQVFNSLHHDKEVGTPRFGGIIVWGSVVLTALLLQILWLLFPDAFEQLAFISRNQTWVPLATLLAGALVGLLDDWYEVRGRQGIALRYRLIAVAIIAALSAWWFYDKLGVSSIAVPFGSGLVTLGIWFIPFFILVALFIYAGGVIDGLDGLAGGIFATMFGAYAGIALFQDQLDLAALCAAIAGGLLAFLWFNIPPARFYLSETGTMGLTLTLVVVAFLTDTIGGGKGVMALPVIALPLVVTVFSNIAQMTSKRFFGRKLLRVAPLHHHFEALGWPSYKVVMRYWIVGVVAAILGMTIALL